MTETFPDRTPDSLGPTCNYWESLKTGYSDSHKDFRDNQNVTPPILGEVAVLSNGQKPRDSRERKQRATFQMKEQDKTSENVLTEMEINDLPVKEFKIMVIMMLT